MSKKYNILLMSILIFTGCDSSLFRSHQIFSQNDWPYADTVSFDFSIKQAGIYDLAYELRHGEAYPFTNIYIQSRIINTQTGAVIHQNLDNILLFDTQTGRPLGSGLGDLFDIRSVFLSSYTFPQSGNYSVQMVQMMRQDPLPFIVSVGLQITQVEIKKQ